MMDTNNSIYSTARASAMLLSLSFALLAGGVISAEQKEPLFKEFEGLNVPAVKPGFSKVEKPLEIDKRKDLKAIFGKGKDMMTLRKDVDFEKQKVLLFRWNGSGKDSLTAKAEPNPKDGAKPRVIFEYVPGLTRDLRFHAKAYVLPKAVKWEVAANKLGAAKVVAQVGPKPGGLIIRADGVRIPLPQKNVVVEAKPVPVLPPVPPGKGVIRGGLKPAIINGRVPMRGRSMRVYQQWTGFIPDGETPSIELPEKGYVIDEQTWVELWHAWRPTEKVPAVNFQNEIIFLGSQAGKTRVYVRAVKTEEGEVTMSVNGSGNIKGISYSFGKFMRAGVVSVNGERLPGAPD